ncbi:response regulator [Peterkaempfera bronchialis]|uniref:PAS domain-containing protein n=1 Tax=Peterkaempfera bronchialis TaxID=2126346 RepID=A0A345SYD2_9ACTN|nr:PAS domain-containing protein [Peterkaempfera bronchialis]AXI78737.1 PAS domain-containing protein [Peterkaempfera bronchialis]
MSSRPTRGAARLAAILDALPDALLLVNSNGTVVDANTAAVESLQAPGTSLVGMGVLGLLPEFDPSRIPGSMRPAPSDPDSADGPVRMTARRTDGTTFPVEVSSNDFEDEGSPYSPSPLTPYDPFRSSSGWAAPGYGGGSEGSARELLLILVRDLSDRLDVEAELRRQHKQTEMILRAAAEGIVGVDLEGRVVLINPAAAHILGFRASELGGRELHPLVQHSRADGTALAAEESPLADTLSSGRKHRVRGTVLWRKDGRPVTVDLTTAPVRDGDQLVGAVMTFTDRTKELALAARGRHLTAVLEQELRGSLDQLRQRIDGLAADPAGQLWPEANWTLRRLADECARFSRLVDGVLSYQRFESAVESGKEALDRKPVDVEKIVQRAVKAAGELVGADRVRVSLHVASVEVVADAARLAQALAHLVTDVSGVPLSLDPADQAPRPAPYGATPALPPAGSDVPVVVMAAAQRGDVARIEVRGPGDGGSPVHLPIARGMVERHGGVLQSHRLPDGKGTTYVVELPLDPVAARAAAERAGAAGRRDAPKESDTAVLPELPDGIPAPPVARRPEESEAPKAPESPEAPEQANAGRRGGKEQQAPRAPIALGPGPSGAAPEGDGGPRPPRQRTPQDEPQPGAEPASEGSGRQGGGQRRRRALPAAEGAESYPGDPAPHSVRNALPPAAADARPGPAVPPQSTAFAMEPVPPRETPAEAVPPGADPAGPGPGTPANGMPFPAAPAYPGLENALPPAAAAAPQPAAPVPPPTGRRRRLAVPPGDDVRAPVPAGPAALEAAGPAAPQGDPGAAPAPVPTGSGPAALEPARSESVDPFVTGPGAFPGGYPQGPGDPARPVAALQANGVVAGPVLDLVAPGEPGQPADAPRALEAAPMALPAAPDVPAHTPPQPIAVPPLSGTDDTDGAGLETAGAAVAPEAGPEDQPAAGVPSPDGGPRRLLVWPEPDPSTKEALKERGYRPVIVRSREEVDAQVPAYPAALFVDPLTGPITRTALQSLRTAAVNAHVPVLVTAGLGQATREAAYGADPAVLLRALSPRDSESHAPRVLLVEADSDIATAFSSSLERRGMHVEHAASESDAVSRASSVQPNLVVMDLMLVRRRRVGIVDWLRANDRLHRTPMVIYTSGDIDPQELPRLRTGETVLFLAERSTSADVQGRIVDLLSKIGPPTADAT